jgi:UDP-glucose 4-epimerase
MKKNKFLVTGGAGFIGSNLVDLLIQEGHEVVVVDNLSTGKKANINKNAQFIEADLNCCSQDIHPGSVYRQFPCPSRDTKIVEEAAKNVDGIFHLAALARVQPSIEDPIKYNNTNVNGTLNILFIAQKLGVKRFVYSASSSAYGNAEVLPTSEDCPTDPLSPYGLQKLIGEQYCRVFYHCYGLETVSLRYFNVFGERQSLDSGAYKLVMSVFAQQRLEGKPLTITGDGEQRRDFTYVGDVAKSNLLAMTSKNVGSGEVINIGCGDNRSVNQLADLMGGEKTYIEKRLEPQETLADNSKAKKLLQWEPTVSIEDWVPKYKKSLNID